MTRLELTLEELGRTSPGLGDLLAQLVRAAATDTPVLIVGEPGTGRSTLARAVHGSSRRRGRPLVEVDPTVVPASLFESELFGYRAGAFTGAAGFAVGRVGLASRGTLVLDHVEELPLPAQPKLLRLVAERIYAPLGDREREADVRFVAVASEDLPRRVERGAFRRDLFHRIEVLSFRLPPLRERMDDLEPLIRHFLADLGERFGRSGLELSEESRAWMVEHPWPGNLRELRNVLERAVVMNSDDVLDPQPGSTGDRPRPLTEVERDEIVKALAYTRGHQGRAAELLGISRKSLWERRRRFGIP